MPRVRFVLLVGVTLLWFPACATMEKSEVAVVETKPQVSPTIAEAPKASERLLKRNVAIARFSNETKYGQSFFLDQNRDWVGKQAMDILSAKLTATDKFILLERADLDKINNELKMGSLQALNIPADHLIVGSVSEFGRKTVSDVGIFSRVKKQVAYAKVNVRLIDIHTGRILYSAEGDGEAFSEAGTVFGVGSRADYDATLNDKAISAAIGKLVNNIIENLLDKPWRAYLLSYQGGSYMMSGGKSQGIRPGDVFAVYQKGEKVKNPQTGMLIELPGRMVGTLKVVETVGADATSEVSVCVTESGTIPTANFGDVYIQESKERR
ncbi:MAG: curli production assembly protein CsgG [candidate division NC10 bacterium RBG_16_65_8]|nr:MAG: curli production assembly protein CsgG [candidate division NC10 bacterium RBG_16_65_8]